MRRDKNLILLLLQKLRDGKMQEGIEGYTEEEIGFHAGLLAEDGYADGRPIRDHTNQLRGASIVGLTSAGYDLLESLEESHASETAISTPPAMRLSLFLSHSSKDVEVASALIELLILGLSLKSEEIRCTSVPGFLLPSGVVTDEVLKQEVKESKAFIGLITPSSIESAYVLFELGARWGAGLPFSPLLSSGADASFLRGPLNGIMALNATSEDQMRQLLGELANQLEIKVNEAGAYGNALRAFVAQAKVVPTGSKTTTTALAPNLPEFTEQVLRFATRNQEVYPEILARALQISHVKAEHYAEVLETHGLLDQTWNGDREKYFYLTAAGRAVVVSKGFDQD